VCYIYIYRERERERRGGGGGEGERERERGTLEKRRWSKLIVIIIIVIIVIIIIIIIIGTLVKRMWTKQRGLAAQDVYHVCIMPCYDKKLEVSFDTVLGLF
jgi:hypothetical protein